LSNYEVSEETFSLFKKYFVVQWAAVSKWPSAVGKEALSSPIAGVMILRLPDYPL